MEKKLERKMETGMVGFIGGIIRCMLGFYRDDGKEMETTIV